MIDVKSSYHYYDLKEILNGENEIVNWKIQTCLSVFNIRQCMLICVLLDKNGGASPKVTSLKYVANDSLLQSNYKLVVANYVRLILQNYLRDNMSLDLNSEERTFLVNYLSEYVEKQFSIEREIYRLEQTRENGNMKLTIRQKCKEIYSNN